MSHNYPEYIQLFLTIVTYIHLCEIIVMQSYKQKYVHVTSKQLAVCQRMFVVVIIYQFGVEGLNFIIFLKNCV